MRDIVLCEKCKKRLSNYTKDGLCQDCRKVKCKNVSCRRVFRPMKNDVFCELCRSTKKVRYSEFDYQKWGTE